MQQKRYCLDLLKRFCLSYILLLQKIYHEFFAFADRTRNEKAFPDVIPEREVIRHDLGYHGPCPDSPTDEHQIPDPFRPISTSSFPPYASCNNKSTRQREEPFHRGADPLHENAVMSISVPDAQRHYPDLSEGKSNTFHDPASGVGHPDYVDMDGPDYAVLDGPDYSDGPDDVDVDCPVYGNTNGSDNCQDYADDDGPDLADRDCPNSSGIRIPDYGVYDEEDYAELSPVIIEKSCTLNLRNRLSYKPSRDELPYRPTEIRSSASMTRKDCFSHDSSKSNYPKQDNKGRVGIDKDRPVITKSNTFTGRVKPFEMKQFKTGRAMATFKQSTSNAELKSTQQIDKKDTECVKLDNDDIYLEPNAMVQEYERAMPQKSANSQEKTPTLPGIAFRPGVREKVEPNVMEEAQRAEDDESLYVTPNSVIPELRRAHTEKMPPRAKGKSPIMLDYRVGSPMKRKQSKPHIIGRMAAQGNDTATYVQPNAVIPEFKRAHTEKIRPRLSPNIIGPVRSEYTIGTPSFRGDEPVFMERDEPLGDASIYEEPCVMIPELKRASTERTRARFSETSSRVCPVAGLEITKDYEPRVNPAPDLYTHRDHSIPADLNICTPQDSFYDNCGFTMEEENPYYGGMATAGEPLFDVYQSINEEADIYASVLPDA